jgi:hypothetical protein
VSESDFPTFVFSPCCWARNSLLGPAGSRQQGGPSKEFRAQQGIPATGIPCWACCGIGPSREFRAQQGENTKVGKLLSSSASLSFVTAPAPSAALASPPLHPQLRSQRAPARAAQAAKTELRFANWKNTSHSRNVVVYVGLCSLSLASDIWSPYWSSFVEDCTACTRRCVSRQVLLLPLPSPPCRRPLRIGTICGRASHPPLWHRPPCIRSYDRSLYAHHTNRLKFTK